MRILAVTPYYSPEGGGLERYAHAILQRLARDHDVRVVAQTRGRPYDDIQDGVRVERRRPKAFAGNAPIDPGLHRHLRDIVVAWCPDVIVAHAPVPFPAEVASQVARRHGIPFVLTYHAGRLRGSNRMLDAAATLLRWTVERRMIHGSDALIAVSPFVRDHALRARREHVVVVPPGVDERFQPAGTVGKDILFVAPLAHAYRWKGVDNLVQAFRLVQAQVSDARLHIIGDGDRRAEFERLADASGGQILVEPRRPDDGLIQAYQNAAVVALPSTTDAEAFGMVLAEANACGRPVVASRIGGIPDFVEHGKNGLLVAPHDVDELAASMIRLLTDPHAADRMGGDGRRRVQTAHDWDVLAARTAAVLEDACAA